MIDYADFVDLKNRIKSLLHEEKVKQEKINHAECYEMGLIHKYWIILRYSQIFILLKAAFLLERIQKLTILINYKPNGETKYSFLEQKF